MSDTPMMDAVMGKHAGAILDAGCKLERALTESEAARKRLEAESEAKSVCLNAIAESLGVDLPYGELYSAVDALKAELAAVREDAERLRYRIARADACILRLTAGTTDQTDRGLEMARTYMSVYGDHPDNAAIDAARKP